MREWLSDRLLDLAYYAPIPFLGYVLVGIAMNMINDGAPVQCIGIKKWMEWELEIDQSYVMETESLVDRGAFQAESSGRS